MKKFHVTIQFEMDNNFMSLIPAHRAYINSLIEKGIIDQYAVSMESLHVWITLSAQDKEEVKTYISKSPIFKYWSYTIDELFAYDGQYYRLPTVQLN